MNDAKQKWLRTEVLGHRQNPLSERRGKEHNLENKESDFLYLVRFLFTRIGPLVLSLCYIAISTNDGCKCGE